MRVVPADFEPGYASSMDNNQPKRSPGIPYDSSEFSPYGTAAHSRTVCEDVDVGCTGHGDTLGIKITGAEGHEMQQQAEDQSVISPERQIGGDQTDEGRTRHSEGVGVDYQLTLPQPISRASTASSVSSSQDNLTDSDLEAALAHPMLTRVGSVQVTEWGLEHVLQLREDEEEDSEQGLTLDIDGEQATKADAHDPNGQAEGVKLGRDLRASPPIEHLHNALSSSESSGQPTPEKTTVGGDASKKNSLEDSLRMLNFDTPLPLSPSESTGYGSGGVDWWAQALAETQNVTDNFDALDALVEKLDEAESAREGSMNPSGTPSVSAKLDVDHQSRMKPGTTPTATHETSSERGPQLSGNKEKEGMALGGVLKIRFPEVAGALKPARSEGSLSQSLDDSGESLSRSHTHSSSQQELGGFTIARGSLKTEGSRFSGQASRSTTSSMESLGSVGKRRKTKSRSPSPATQSKQGSPLPSSKSAYIVQAGRLIKKGLEYERSGEYKDAFDLFKAGVDVLLNGVQSKLIEHHHAGTLALLARLPVPAVFAAV